MKLEEIVAYLRDALANSYSDHDKEIEAIIDKLAATEPTDLTQLEALADQLGSIMQRPGMEGYDSVGMVFGALDELNLIIDAPHIV